MKKFILLILFLMAVNPMTAQTQDDNSTEKESKEKESQNQTPSGDLQLDNLTEGLDGLQEMLSSPELQGQMEESLKQLSGSMDQLQGLFDAFLPMLEDSGLNLDSGKSDITEQLDDVLKQINPEELGGSLGGMDTLLNLDALESMPKMFEELQSALEESNLQQLFEEMQKTMESLDLNATPITPLPDKRKGKKFEL